MARSSLGSLCRRQRAPSSQNIAAASTNKDPGAERPHCSQEAPLALVSSSKSTVGASVGARVGAGGRVGAGAGVGAGGRVGAGVGADWMLHESAQ